MHHNTDPKNPRDAKERAKNNLVTSTELKDGDINAATFHGTSSLTSASTSPTEDKFVPATADEFTPADAAAGASKSAPMTTMEDTTAAIGGFPKADAVTDHSTDPLYTQALLIARRMMRPCNESALHPAPPHSEQELIEAVVGRCVQALSQGSTSLSLSTLATLIAQDTHQEHTTETLMDAIQASPWCVLDGTANACASALLIIENQMVSLAKYAQLEAECANRIVALMQNTPQLPSVAQAQSIIKELICIGKGVLSPQQVRALAAAICSRFMVLTGGPGTGKTTVVVRILETLRSLAHQQGNAPTVRLAAPTGKAAQRLQESIDASVSSLSEESQAFFAQIDQACTVQRLLGQNYGALTSYKHSGEAPLWGDIFIIDEVSMVPLDLMVTLLQCLPPHAQLILVGDPYQLASVEAGTVVADIVDGMRIMAQTHDTHDYDAHDAQSFFTELDNALAAQWTHINASRACPSTEQWDAALQPRCARGLVELTRAHRFGDNVGGLVQAIKAVGDASHDSKELERATQAVFAQTVASNTPTASADDLCLPCVYPQLTDARPGQSSLETQLVDFYRQLEELMAHRQIEDALSRLDDMRLLCANNRGTKGAQDFNLRIGKLLAQRYPQHAKNQYGERLGCVLMATRNERLLSIANGDTGLLGLTEDGIWTVYFPDGSGSIHAVPRSRIECISLAYAITIHKSQGSQYAHAIVHLATNTDSPLNVRELFYTGVSRARKQVSIVGSTEAIVHAAQTAITRASGLTARLTNEITACGGRSAHHGE